MTSHTAALVERLRKRLELHERAAGALRTVIAALEGLDTLERQLAESVRIQLLDFAERSSAEVAREVADPLRPSAPTAPVADPKMTWPVCPLCKREFVPVSNRQQICVECRDANPNRSVQELLARQERGIAVVREPEGRTTVARITKRCVGWHEHPCNETIVSNGPRKRCENCAREHVKWKSRNAQQSRRRPAVETNGAISEPKHPAAETIDASSEPNRANSETTAVELIQSKLPPEKTVLRMLRAHEALTTHQIVRSMVTPNRRSDPAVHRATVVSLLKGLLHRGCVGRTSDTWSITDAGRKEIALVAQL